MSTWKSRHCEVCGKVIHPFIIYCSTCGLRVAENKGRPSFENYMATGFNSITRSTIYACHLVKLPIFTRILVERNLWGGDLEIELCGCPECKQFYREYIAEKNILLRDGPTDPHCKEIVNLVYNKDIRGLRINIKDFFQHQFMPKYFPNGFDD